MRPEIIEAPPQQSAQTLDTSHWRLMLIRQAGEERVALLNGRLLKVGGRIDGAQVKAIEAHKVILQLADERSIEIRLPSVELRKIGE
jgi:hypothetical protein